MNGWSKVWTAIRRGFRRGPAAGPGDPRARGRWGEDLAARMLHRKGFRVEGVRVRVDRRNELDLVAWEGDDTLVFVEVKTRRTEDYGRPIDAVTPAKQAHLSRAAVRYLSRMRRKPAYIRFDVVEIVGEPGAPAPRMEHIVNAFPLHRRYKIPW
jgi:putative endonuclease